MALLDGDWSVAANGDIRSVTNTTTHTVLELHRWLMDKLDNTTSAGDDILFVGNAIIPSTRKTDNIIVLNSPYNIDDTASYRFYDGSIEQLGGTEKYGGLEVVGSVASTTTLMIIQNGAVLANFWGDTTSALYADTTNNVLLRCIIKIRSADNDIDGRRLRVQARELGDSYAAFNVTLGDAISTAAIFTNNDDFDDASGASHVAVTHTDGYTTIDLDQDLTPEPYYIEWNRNTDTEQEMYQRAKYWTRRGETTETFAGIPGELFVGITHEWDFESESGIDFVTGEELQWGTGQTFGEATVLAVNYATGTTGTVWVQLLRGVAPTDGIAFTGQTGSATANVSTGTVVTRSSLSTVLGNYTGSTTGAFGVGFTTNSMADTAVSRDLLNVTHTPPTVVDVVVTDIVSGDIIFSAKTKSHTDAISGGPTTGTTAITLSTGVPADYDQIGRVIINNIEYVFTAHSGTSLTLAEPGLTENLSGAEVVTFTQFFTDEYTTTTVTGGEGYNNSGDSKLRVTGNVINEWPDSGKVRVWNGTGFDQYSYNSGGIDTVAEEINLTTTLSQTYSNVDLFIPYIDEVAAGTSITKSIVYPGSPVSGRHRLYNSSSEIVPFEVGFSIGANGASSPLIRNADA